MFTFNPQAEQSLFSDRNVSVDYTFKHKNSKGATKNESDSHTVEPSVYLEWKEIFGITAGVIYQRADAADLTSTRQAMDTYGPDLTVDWEFGHHFIDKKNDLQLWFEPNLSYSVSNGKKQSGAGTVESEGEEYDLVPAIILTKKIRDTGFTITLRPSYAFAIARTTFNDGSPHENTHGGVFTFLARTDYAVNDNFKVIAFAAWNRDVNESGNGSSATLRDWATFGGGVKWTAKE